MSFRIREIPHLLDGPDPGRVQRQARQMLRSGQRVLVSNQGADIEGFDDTPEDDDRYEQSLKLGWLPLNDAVSMAESLLHELSTTMCIPSTTVSTVAPTLPKRKRRRKKGLK